MITLFTMVGASFTLVMLLMGILWGFYFFQKNARLIDIGWGVGILLTAWAYLFLGEGNLIKTILLTLMATLWAGRLTWHLFERYQKSSHEDPRYEVAIQRWKDNHSPYTLVFILLMLQGCLIILLSLPFLLVSIGSTDQWSSWELWGILFWLIGLTGETAADAQLAKFRADPANASKVCNQGLWRFSRHPNYFFDFIVWVGFALFACPSSWGWLAFVSPLIMLLMFLRFTGIPLTEAESLRSKGDSYREYQKKTSPFIPWFPSD